ncbi:putative disintegrin and metalloproteinase with thrombospondin motif adt-2 [Dirofilaria immitis]
MPAEETEITFLPLLHFSILIFHCQLIESTTAPFLSAEELRYTFGVNTFSDVPQHEELYPETEYSKDGQLKQIQITIHKRQINLTLQPSIQSLISPNLRTIFRNAHGGGKLDIGVVPANCHYQHKSEEVYAAISNCDGNLTKGQMKKGVIMMPDEVYVLHPLPDRHVHRFDQNSRNDSDSGLHVIYKREVAQKEFCGLESIITSAELTEDENEVSEDIFAVGQRLNEKSELIVELAIFVDEMLWKLFSSKYGIDANSKLQDYALTMLNNIQIMYHQPSAIPQLSFHVVRFEMLTTQPSTMAAHLHNNGHAQKYLDRFCHYQRNLGSRDWDHALMLTGYDIHRGTGSRSISGIARLDGMCDPWNTCTLAEGLDFTSAFIGTHELGHSVGMRHDEPYCPSKHIMSSSLGPGKVTWSMCSLRDYHAFLQRLDNRGKNCLRVSNLPQKLTVRTDIKPGQVYNADMQCYIMHGRGYRQISPRQDHYDGICYMMWCGQSTFGRIITSHPALEGTFCGPSKWCELGRCVPWPGISSSAIPKRTDGQWSNWSKVSCQSCNCAEIAGSISIAKSTRSCNNPPPSNGGAECVGATLRAVVCNRHCTSSNKSVNKHIKQQCMQQKKLKNDSDLSGSGTQLTRYPQRACKVFCDVKSRYGSQRNYRFFGNILPDGAPCGNKKYCLDGECLSLSCDSNALITRDVSCPSVSERCPQGTVITSTVSTIGGAQWLSWSSWSFCSQTCGAGYRQRIRLCSDGKNQCLGASSEKSQCNLLACDGDRISDQEGNWSEWTVWNQCSVSCGTGWQARYRRCSIPLHNSISFSCTENSMETRQCNMEPCNTGIIGLWGSWTEWSQCSVSCGPGIRSRNRYCTKEPCDGSGQSRMSCNLGPCEISAKWLQWQAWSQCSLTCGKGIRTRKRKCSATNGCFGNSMERQKCNEEPCMATAIRAISQWSGWSDWSACSTTCGGGFKRRIRICQYGTCNGPFKESLPCMIKHCKSFSAVNSASWGGWGYWSPCSETCGKGVRKRVRKCYGVGGKCFGNEYEREICNVRRC